MVFSSPAFLFLFFPLFLLLYFAAPRPWRNGLILAASALFYVLGAGGLTVVALALLVLNWALGHAIHRARASGRTPLDRHLLVFGVAANLAPLIFYKYLAFLVNVVRDLTGLTVPGVYAGSVVLPLGISFYVFHFISYLVDVYRGRNGPESSIARFAIYIFLFPHLVAGPVVRYTEVREQLSARHRELVSSAIYWGAIIFMVGLAKKVLLADPLGAVVDSVHKPGAALSTYAAWLAAFCYSFQIYFDFSGYTDMAIGMARMMGFRFPQNFNRPYAAANITQFWQRWHMTLSRFFRDYVYIPLGGNRAGNLAVYRNLMIVFVLCALWHGAAYTFLAWGVGHGLVLVLERAGWVKPERLRLGALPVFVIATVLWVPFRAASMDDALRMWQAMAGIGSAMPLWLDANRVLADFKVIFLFAVATLVCLLPDRAFHGLRLRALRRPVLLGTYALIVFVWSAITVVDQGFNPFIYFQF